MRPREEQCTPADGRARLEQARQRIEIAELTLDVEPAPAALLAVQAGIAIADAVCCSKLGVRSRAQAHGDAIKLLNSVPTVGAQLALDLGRLLSMKDSAEYSPSVLSMSKARDAVKWARRMYDRARAAF